MQTPTIFEKTHKEWLELFGRVVEDNSNPPFVYYRLVGMICSPSYSDGLLDRKFSTEQDASNYLKTTFRIYKKTVIDNFHKLIQSIESAKKIAIQEGDTDKVARLEVCYQYWTNPNFRKYLEEMTWSVVGSRYFES